MVRALMSLKCGRIAQMGGNWVKLERANKKEMYVGKKNWKAKAQREM